MRTQRRTVRLGLGTVLGAALAALCLSAAASAETVWTKFAPCPTKGTGVAHCLYSVTNGGEVLLGKKKAPITNKVILQGGYTEENEETGFESFVAPTSGETLSKAAQSVEGGLLGIVPEAGEPFLVKLLEEYFLKNKFLELNATLELAKPASEIKLSTFSLLAKFGTALQLPVKVHLENPFLGRSCYVGSSTSPIIWNLTTGKTSPPEGHEAIKGKAGFPNITESDELTEITENELVENDWKAPEATGCGGIISFLLDPIIDAEAGLPSEAGVSVAKLKNTIFTATSGSVEKH
jgi:hypothetical protein